MTIGRGTSGELARLLVLLHRGVVSGGDAREALDLVCRVLGARQVRFARSEHGTTVRLRSPFVEELFLNVSWASAAAVSEDDRLLLELLAPRVADAVATRRALAAIREPGDESWAEAARRARAHGLVAWPSGEVELTPSARALWAGLLGDQGASGWRRIARAIARAAMLFVEGQPGSRSQILIPGLRAELAFLPDVDAERRILVVFSAVSRDPENRRGPTPAEALLTPQELSIARAAAEGRSLAEIGRALGISTETARTHMKAVYQRLRITRRVELARLLGGDPE
jgi:DNA-binding CsgD family transcriptional regulator